MTGKNHQFVPLKDPLTIPVRWEFKEHEYTQLVKGNDESKSVWRCFMADNTFHIYKGFTGGLEHFRFSFKKGSNSTHIVDNLETFNRIDFYKSAKRYGWTKTEIENQKLEHNKLSVAEVTELFSYFFNIDLVEKSK